MHTSRPLRPRRFLLPLPFLAIFAVGTSAHAAVLLGNFDLGGTRQTTTAWENLTYSNPSQTPSSGTGGTIGYSVTAFPGSYGFYSYSSDYTVTATQIASFDIASVVWQIECSPNPDEGYGWPYAGGPVLTVVTGSGTRMIEPIAFLAGDSELRQNYGSSFINYTAYAWQWNLSSIEETITSITLTAPISIHTSVSASQIDVGDAFVQVIPEPSSLLLCLAALPFAARRRRSA